MLNVSRGVPPPRNVWPIPGGMPNGVLKRWIAFRNPVHPIRFFSDPAFVGSGIFCRIREIIPDSGKIREIGTCPNLDAKSVPEALT